MAFETAARTHVGRRRKVNEDSILASPEHGLWVVADGMGGHHAGDVASALVVEGLGDCGGGRLEARAADAERRLQAINARLVAMGQGGDQPRTIGSTVALLIVEGDEFACLWAGDSRVYLARSGALSQLTRDHSLVQDLVDMGEIDPAEAASHPNGNIITRAVGADETLRLDVVRGQVLAGDAFLLASDGLTRLVGDAEMLLGLAAERLEASADRLLDACLERGAPDNVSFILIRAP
jgi:serine/threonine protein phosphatase Stp1